MRRKLAYLRRAPKDLSREEYLSHERYRRIVWSGAAAIASKIVAAFVGIATLPMMVHYVGKEQFGLWMVVSSLVVWMQLAEFGIANGLSNALAEANGRDDAEAASGYLSTALAVTTGLSLLCLPLVYVAYTWVPLGRLLNITDPVLGELAAGAFAVVGLAFVINIPLSLAGRVYIAYQVGYVSNVAQAVVSIATFLGLLLGIKTGLDLLWLVGISAGIPVFVNTFLWLGFHRAGIPLRVDLCHVRRAFLSRVAVSSVPLFLFQCCALLVNQLVNTVIAMVSSLSMVADFNVVQRIYLFVFSLAAALSTPFYAAIREAIERGDSNWAFRAVGHGLLIRLLATLPFALVLLAFGDGLVKAWIGADSAHPIGTLGWAFVVFSLGLAAVSSLLSEVLSCLDDIWAQVGLALISATVVLSSMLLLLPHFGIAGAFLAFALSTLLPIAWLSARLRSRFLSTRPI